MIVFVCFSSRCQQGSQQTSANLPLAATNYRSEANLAVSNFSSFLSPLLPTEPPAFQSTPYQAACYVPCYWPEDDRTNRGPISSISSSSQDSLDSRDSESISGSISRLSEVSIEPCAKRRKARDKWTKEEVL